MFSKVLDTINNSTFIKDWNSLSLKTYEAFNDNIKPLYLNKKSIHDDFLKELYTKRLTDVYHHLIKVTTTYNSTKGLPNNSLFQQMYTDILDMINYMQDFKICCEIISDCTGLNIYVPEEILDAYDAVSDKASSYK